jgi:hypothetical protein
MLEFFFVSIKSFLKANVDFESIKKGGGNKSRWSELDKKNPPYDGT